MQEHLKTNEQDTLYLKKEKGTKNANHKRDRVLESRKDELKILKHVLCVTSGVRPHISCVSQTKAKNASRPRRGHTQIRVTIDLIRIVADVDCMGVAHGIPTKCIRPSAMVSPSADPAG